MENFDWAANVGKILESTYYSSLGTVSENNQPWCNPVYFAYDKEINLYFISNPSSKHVKNMEANNSQIAMAIYIHPDKTDPFRKGLQIIGTGKVMQGDDLKRAVEIYFGRESKKGNTLDYEGNVEWRLYKVTPSEIWYFDTEFFSETRQKVPDNLVLNM